MQAEWVGWLAAILTTAAFVPQAVLTLRSRDTRSLSAGMYSLFTAGVLCWLLYGVVRRDAALVLANAVTFGLAATILAIKLQNLLRTRR